MTVPKHYDPDKLLAVSFDASPYGVDAVLAHKIKDGAEKPGVYASKPMSLAEKNYLEVYKEALSGRICDPEAPQLSVRTTIHHIYRSQGLAWYPRSRPCGTCHGFGSYAEVGTDHGTYQYDSKYRQGCDNANADGLSRLPFATLMAESPRPSEVIHLLEHVSMSGLDVVRMNTLTQRDPVLSRVLPVGTERLAK